MGETIEEMDKKIELIDHTINFLTGTLGFSLEETVEQMQRVNLFQILDKTDRVTKRLYEALKKHRENT